MRVPDWYSRLIELLRQDLPKWSKYFDMPYYTLQNIALRGRSPMLSTVAHMVERGLNPVWLFYGLGEPLITKPEEAAQALDESGRRMAVRWVPYVGDVGAGPAILQYGEGAVELFPVPVRLLHPATSPIVVSVGRGQESMSPTLLPGDWVVVDRAPIRRTDPKDIYLIRDPDEPEAALALKRVIAAGAHTVILLSDNPAFEPRRIRLPGNMSPADILVGRVALVLRPMAPARRPRKRKKTQPTEEARVS